MYHEVLGNLVSPHYLSLVEQFLIVQCPLHHTSPLLLLASLVDQLTYHRTHSHSPPKFGK